MAIILSTILTSVLGYYTLFFIIVAGSFAIIPGMTLLISSYASVLTTVPRLFLFILLVFAASIIGDIGTYFIAKRFSVSVINYLKRYKWFAKNEGKARSSVRNYGFYFVFVTRFISGGLGPVVNYISGFERLNSKKFILAVLLGEAVYALLFCSIGYIFKDTWAELVSFLQYSFVAILLIVIALYVGYRITKFYRRK